MQLALLFAAAAVYLLLILPTPLLTPTGRFMNVTSCVFTPTGGTATAIKGVQDATISYNPENYSEGGDADLYNTSSGLTRLDPQINLTFLNALALAAVPSGTPGQLVVTFGDSRNQALAGGGGMIYTVSNCYHMEQPFTVAHRTLSRRTAVFMTQSLDGQTSPVASAAA